MSIQRILRYNQTTFIAIGISLLIVAGFFGCRIFDQPPEKTAAQAAAAAAAIGAVAPPPYKEILIAISALLSSGLFVDNRRKDTVIKVLKSHNANQDPPSSNPSGSNRPDPPG